MKKKRKIFCWGYILILCVPLMTMNYRNDFISSIDNTYLPNFSLSITFIKDSEEYINKRIGGREWAIKIYEEINDKLFNILEHPLYVYGTNKQVFCKGESYLADYQHLNSDTIYADEFTNYIDSLSDIAADKGAYFLYVLCTDKKTVYSDCYIEGVNVSDNKSRTEEILEALDAKGIHYLYSKDCLVEAKEQGIEVYNRAYDVGHWNDNGAFLFSKDIFKDLKATFPEINILNEEDFRISTETERYLGTSYFVINERVPKYEAINEYAIEDISTDWYELLPGNEIYFKHYINESANDLKILVFRDSYLDRASKFFINYFGESTFVSYGNLTSISDYENYLDILEPNIIIFENVERTFPLEILH